MHQIATAFTHINPAFVLIIRLESEMQVELIHASICSMICNIFTKPCYPESRNSRFAFSGLFHFFEGRMVGL